ncbi:hypothetical protein BXZ70DRAFT_941514 [Cristinia sonorae]|uniref:BTB domain-containing protein n=1 Tax=Cristinia sonorae TaxID=1940300 RepID=A0A8K0ULN7_9AGAR|nr:hypothetical protein BXZ70DRAFT_941514 [Cristinia sonorae]
MASQLNPILRHTDLWYEDGNVVIVADRTAFKVHRTILSQHSLVFADMFSFPQPATNPDESYDGCPMVQVSDNATDMAIVLDIFYNGVTYLLARTQPTWKVVRAMALLGLKYQADRIRNEAVHQLSLVYGSRDVDEICSMQPGVDCMSLEDDDFISIVNVIRSLDLSRKWLVLALYDCCQMEAALIVNGLPSTERLSPADVVRCVEARSELVDLSRDIMEDWFAEQCSSSEDRDLEGPCSAFSTCERILAQLRRVRLPARSKRLAKHDPLLIHCELAETWFFESCASLCVPCATYYKRRDSEARQHILASLDSYFHFPEDNEMTDVTSDS